jgi:hypothetical protein
VRCLLSAAIIASPAALAAGCTTGHGAVNLDTLRNADAPYYYVGPSFDGLGVSHVEQYQGGVADIIYGTCEAKSDQGCAPPLELQHRLCRGRVTVVIFVGQDAKSDSAARAADALRPLSKGAREQEPDVAFDSSPLC